jgi:hypothetical protein
MVFIDVWRVTRADSPVDKSSQRLKVMLASEMPVSGDTGDDAALRSARKFPAMP